MTPSDRARAVIARYDAHPHSLATSCELREAMGELIAEVERQGALLAKAEGLLRAVRDNGGALKAITVQYPPRGGNFNTVLELVKRYFVERDV